jgi:hypothetical protein
MPYLQAAQVAHRSAAKPCSDVHNGRGNHMLHLQAAQAKHIKQNTLASFCPLPTLILTKLAYHPRPHNPNQLQLSRPKQTRTSFSPSPTHLLVKLAYHP